MGAAAVSAAVVLAAVVVTTRGPSSGGGETAADPAVVAQAGSRRTQFVPEGVPAGATRLLLVVDSGPIFLAPELEDVAARTGSSYAVGLSAILDCAPALLSPEVRYAGDVIVPREPCPDVRRERWERHAEAMQADVVVYYVANAGGLGEQWLEDAWRTDCDPVFDTLLEQEVGRDVDALTATGATVVLATSPDVAVLMAESNDQTACRNETYRRVVADHPGTLMIDLHGFVRQLELPPGEAVMQDFVHLSGPAAERVAAWMLPAVDVALSGAGAAASQAA